MRYLRDTSTLKLTFGSGKLVLVSYTDSNMAGDVDNRRPTLGYLMTFSGGAVFWQSRLQKSVALSTTEAEYIAATEACKELLWMNISYMSSGLSSSAMWYTVITSAPFPFVRILLFMQDRSTLM